MDLQTLVDKEMLGEWCRRLPECELFLGNFFCSCRPYTLETNFLNYAHDIAVQTEIDPSWERYHDQLMLAFIDITGYCGQSN